MINSSTKHSNQNKENLFNPYIDPSVNPSKKGKWSKGKGNKGSYKGKSSWNKGKSKGYNDNKGKSTKAKVSGTAATKGVAGKATTDTRESPTGTKTGPTKTDNKEQTPTHYE